ncbi:MAG: glycoside hydrolase [Ruminiclostridium sp.]|nr:glycoside hydrolase [Ruminiclostridium sp.]
MRREAAARSKKIRNLIIILISIVVITACLSGAAYAIYYFIFMPNSNVVPAFEEGRLNLVIEDEVIKEGVSPKIVEDRILIPLKVMKKYIDEKINWDKELHKLTITTKERVIRMKTDSLEAFINNKPVYLDIPVTEDNGEVFVPLEFLSDFYGIEIRYLKENNVILINFKNRIRQTASPLDTEAVVRKGMSVHYPVLKKLDRPDDENTMIVFEEYDKWYKVRTSDGIVGYIEKRFVVVKLQLLSEMPPEKEGQEVWKPENGKINMAWDYTNGATVKLSSKKKIEGLDVISPTWFQVTGEDGTIKNGADAKYVEWAHNNGYKVWALFSNNFGDAVKSGSFLRNTDARDNAIRQILAFASLYDLDGINLDFENLLDTDKDALTQFVREITPLLREQGLIVSVDINTLPCYDRQALGEIADYIALMAYDQHWKGGGQAGSVSEVDWADRTVDAFLKSIPPGKLILGMPFYTRLWKLTPDGNGKNELTSQALSMEDAKKQVEENNVAVVWEEAHGQFYAEYEKEGSTYKVWLEDINSLNLRTSLVHKYKLAGAAAWRLDFETPDVWSVITGNLKSVGSYAQWKQKNGDKTYVYAR